MPKKNFGEQILEDTTRNVSPTGPDYFQRLRWCTTVLKTSEESDWITTRASIGLEGLGSLYIGTVVVPHELDLSQEECGSWQTPEYAGRWSADDVEGEVKAPLEGHGGWMEQAELLFYERTAPSWTRSYPIQMNQKWEQILDLYLGEGTTKWDRPTPDGERERVVECVNPRDNPMIIVWQRAGFMELLWRCGLKAVRLIDLVWATKTAFEHDEEEIENGTFRYRTGCNEQGMWIRGMEVLAPREDERRGFRRARDEIGQNPRERESNQMFDTYDWRYRRIVRIRCGVLDTTNYFRAEKGKPFDVSPVFFRPEVLDKYRTTRERYTLRERQLSKRNAWSLDTYHVVPETGYVVTYIIYLADLPPDEQRHWQAYNVVPRKLVGRFGPISPEAEQTDFEGEFPEEHLRPASGRLRDALRRAQKEVWYRENSDEFISATITHCTEDRDLFALAISRLYGAIHDRIDGAGLKTWLLRHGQEREIVNELRSVQRARCALVTAGETTDDADEYVRPLRVVSRLRNVLVGHATPEETRIEEYECMERTHGSLEAAYDDLCGQISSFCSVMTDRLRNTNTDS